MQNLGTAHREEDLLSTESKSELVLLSNVVEKVKESLDFRCVMCVMHLKVCTNN